MNNNSHATNRSQFLENPVNGCADNCAFGEKDEVMTANTEPCDTDSEFSTRYSEIERRSQKRTLAVDPGLLTPEQLLASHKGGRRKTLEAIIAEQKSLRIERNRPFYFVSKLKDKVRWFLDNARVKISYDDFMMVCTIFVLFGTDMRLLSFPPAADHIFAALNTVAFFLFVVEMFLNCWVKTDFSKGIFKSKGYMFSFFFWLDLIAIASMIPDLEWLSSFLGIGLNTTSTLGSKAGRMRIGAKTGRVVRMVRLVRLVKLYKVTSQRRREKTVLEDLRALIDNKQIDQDEFSDYFSALNSKRQSKVGSELSDIITRRVIIAVLLMLCVVPLLSYSSTSEDEKRTTDFLQAVNIEVGNGNHTNCDHLIATSNRYKEFMKNIEEIANDKSLQYLVSLKVTPPRCNSTETIDFENMDLVRELRDETKMTILTSPVTVDGEDYSITAVFNLRSLIEETSLTSIYLTLFVIFMLIFLSVQFNDDAQKLVLTPLEEMMEMVKNVADDPLEDFDFDSLSGGGQYEIRVVQLAIQRITALLRVGFGIAGAEIISTNMNVEGEGAAVLKPMIPGKRMYAIFGFCDIHAFDLCTEKLEDEIMTFVNGIARIVHEEVSRWGGMCNKNLGNAFLMVWRIGNEENLMTNSGKRRKSLIERGNSVSKSNKRNSKQNKGVDLMRIPGLDLVADKALIGFLKVIVEVNRNPQILAYRLDERLKIEGENFELRMGFGLHAGWAIEGAVGSLQKVDATYLSPHVNMAARMEAASRQFGVALLMTDQLYQLMSIDAQEHCRMLDVVTVKGSAVPVPIYTYDTMQNQVFPILKTHKFSSLSLEDMLLQQADAYTSLAWIQDEDLVQLRRLATPDFKDAFRDGISNYLSGNWPKARIYLKMADKIMTDKNTGGDGPSQTILSYMCAKGWECPSDWQGCRPLTSK